MDAKIDNIMEICKEALEAQGYDIDINSVYQRIIVDDEVSIEFGEQ